MSSFSYITGIPNAPNNPSADQPNMKTNTNSINSWVGIDHKGFTTGQDGWHTLVHLVPQSSPAATLGIGELYSQTVNADQQLFYQSGGGVITQLTGPTAPSIVTNGFTYLPGGLLMQWGSTNAVTSSASTTITFPTPFLSAVFSVQGTVVTNDTSTVRFSLLNAATLTQFVTSQTSTSHFTLLYWMALGK